MIWSPYIVNLFRRHYVFTSIYTYTIRSFFPVIILLNKGRLILKNNNNNNNNNNNKTIQSIQ